ncbi:MAG: hypothetical protein MJ232_06245 [archaeon]|nr:hypothetical protein [archaeon]
MVLLCISIGSVSAIDDSDIGLSSDNVLNYGGGSDLVIGSSDASANLEVNSGMDNSSSRNIISANNQSDVGVTDSLGTSESSSLQNDTGVFALNTTNSSNSLNSSNVVVSTKTADTVKKVTIANIITSASTFKNYVLKYNELPSSVDVGSYTVSGSQFSYLLSMAVKYLNSGKKTSYQITIKSIASKTSSYSINYNVKKSSYLNLANKVISSCDDDGAVLAYVVVGSKKVSFKVYTYALAKCLVFYKSNKYLPNTCLLESDVFVKKVTVSQIIKKAVSFKSFVLKNKKLPSYVVLGNYKLSSPQFTHLMAMAIKYVNAGKKLSTKINVWAVDNKSATYSISKTVSKASYVKFATKLVDYHTLPSYITVESKKVDYRSGAYALAKCLAFYKTEKYLPKTCLIESKVFDKSVKSTFTLSEVLSAAETIKSNVDKKHCLPASVNVGGVSCTTVNFLHMMCAALIDIKNGKTSSVYSVKSIKDPESKIGDWVVTTASKEKYLDLYDRVYNYLNKNGQAPNYASLDGERVDYSLYTYALSKILVYYKNNNVLANSCGFDDKVFESYSSSINKDKITHIYLTTDNIKDENTDNAMLNTLKNTLTKLGYTVTIVGVGPNMHNKAVTEKGCKGPNSLLVCCFGGVDVGCIEEWSGVNKPEYNITPWFYKELNGAKVLSVFYSSPYGKCSNINSKIGRAWDAEYGYALDDPAQFMEDYGISYIQTGDVGRVTDILKSMLSK